TLGGDLDRGAEAVAIALCSFERNIQPMPAALAAVHPYLRRLAQRRGHHVDSPVAIQIAERASTIARDVRRPKSSLFRVCLPLAHRSWISKNRVVLIDDRPRQVTRNGIASGDEQILPA